MLLRWVISVADNALQRDAVVHTMSSIINKRTEGTLMYTGPLHLMTIVHF